MLQLQIKLEHFVLHIDVEYISLKPLGWEMQAMEAYLVLIIVQSDSENLTLRN